MYLYFIFYNMLIISILHLFFGFLKDDVKYRAKDMYFFNKFADLF